MRIQSTTQKETSGIKVSGAQSQDQAKAAQKATCAIKTNMSQESAWHLRKRSQATMDDTTLQEFAMPAECAQHGQQSNESTTSSGGFFIELCCSTR